MGVLLAVLSSNSGIYFDSKYTMKIRKDVTKWEGQELKKLIF